MKITSQSLNLVGCTLEDYLCWCKNNNFSAYKTDTRAEFFDRIADGRIVRDSKTGELVNKRPNNEPIEEKTEA